MWFHLKKWKKNVLHRNVPLLQFLIVGKENISQKHIPLDMVPFLQTISYTDADWPLDDDLEYEDQSYINDEIMRTVPQIPAPLPPSAHERKSSPSSPFSESSSSPYDYRSPSYNFQSSTTMPQSSSLDSVPQKPTVAPPLPPIFDVPVRHAYTPFSSAAYIRCTGRRFT